MGGKPFLTYEQLTSKLRDEKKLCIPADEETRVISLLKQHSYFGLVCGYKKLFKDSSGHYVSGAKIDDIFALYNYDNHLREIFLSAILIIEKHIKSLLSHLFVLAHGDEQREYLNPANYSVAVMPTQDAYKQKQEIKKLISTFTNVVTPPSSHSYIDHQWEVHGNVPLWVATKAMTFGSISKMYSLCASGIQAGVAKEFPTITEGELVGMLDLLSRVRNVCAHNERLYDFAVKNSRAIQDTPLHGQLSIPKNRTGAYVNGKKDLFAALICFKYLLDADDMDDVVNRISKEIELLRARTKLIEKSKILSCMGFPPNWTDISNC